MRMWVKVGLFVSSYLPLFLILVIKNWFNIYMTIIVAIISFICLLIWISVIKISKKGTAEAYKVLKSEDKTKESLNYLIPYIISFIGFDLNKWQDWSALGILLTMLFVVYLNSDLLYINPILSFFKYKIFSIEVYKPAIGIGGQKFDILLLTKKNRFKIGDELIVKDIDDGIFIEVDYNE